MTYDFFADERDKIEILNFIFRETDLQVFDLSSRFDENINEYKSTEEIVSKFDLHSGTNLQSHFNFGLPDLKVT
jgi:hypothetical protein